MCANCNAAGHGGLTHLYAPAEFPLKSTVENPSLGCC
jgi:hypothetical protein